jgi:uncharacterized protein (TIGR03067 family)
MNRVVLCASILIVIPAFADEKTPAADAALRGKWEVTSARFNGSELTGLKGRVLDFGDAEFTTYDREAKGRTLSFALNPKADPKQIDLDRGGDDGKALGIYTVGKDELKLCYAEPGADRPARFESAARGRSFLLVLKRVKD